LNVSDEKSTLQQLDGIFDSCHIIIIMKRVLVSRDNCSKRKMGFTVLRKGFDSREALSD